jgi:uncharacterized protein
MSGLLRFRKALWCVIAALSVFLMSCGSSSEFFVPVDNNISQGKYAEAIEIVRSNRKWYGDKASVLYNLDMGLLYHYAGEPDSSINYLLAAEKEIEDLYTKSISQQVMSFVVNDNILSYEGEDFEKVLINVFLALNYAEKGMTDDALVEARKVDLKLREYARQYDEKNKYQEDAFIRYVAGALYETGGEINDAFISYKKSYEAYQTYSKEYGTSAPSFLLDDLVRTATLMSFDDEAKQYRELGGKSFEDDNRNLGSVIVVVYAGKGPIKVGVKPTITIPDSSGTLHTFQVALPEFKPRFTGSRFYDIMTTTKTDTLLEFSELAENITAIARKSLDDRLALIYLKSGGRALLKFLAAEKMKSEMKKDDESKVKNFLGSLAIDLVIGATEQADLRMWRTLPAEIQLARLSLQPGSYKLKVAASDGNFTLREVVVAVRSGKTSFVIVDDVR